MEVVKCAAVSENVSFLTQVNEHGVKPTLTTLPRLMDISPIREKDFVKFIITQSMDLDLYNVIELLEGEMANTLPKMRGDYWMKLPVQCRKVLEGGNIPACIRPNYTKNDNAEMVMFLKGKVSYIKILKYGQQPISVDQLGPGYYQFQISADTIYCGPHGKPDHVVSLMLRISQINYDPLPPSTPAPDVVHVLPSFDTALPSTSTATTQTNDSIIPTDVAAASNTLADAAAPITLAATAIKRKSTTALKRPRKKRARKSVAEKYDNVISELLNDLKDDA